MEPASQTAIAVMLAAGWTMVFSGIRKRQLALRRPKRRCPSCGHKIARTVCNRH
ncbi:MAG: hypothetical protein ACKVUT_12605 [Gaiella sp.]